MSIKPKKNLLSIITNNIFLCIAINVFLFIICYNISFWLLFVVCFGRLVFAFMFIVANKAVYLFVLII